MEDWPERADYGPAYFDSLDRMDESAVYRKILHLFEMMGETLPSGLVLDAGCGTGHGLTFFQGCARQVAGLDRFLEAMGTAVHRAPGAMICSGNLDVGLPFSDASFDFVFSHEVVEHLRCPEVFLADTFRILRPGGRVLLKTPNAWDLWRLIDPMMGRMWYAQQDNTHIRYYSVLSLKRLLHEAGFVNVKARAGTKPFCDRRIARAFPLRLPRLPIVGNGVVASGVRPRDVPGGERGTIRRRNLHS